MRRSFLSMWFSEKFPELGKVTVQLLSVHTTACSAERDWSKWGLVHAKSRSKLLRRKAEKTIS